MLLAGDALLPTAAVVDYELTLTMPPDLPPTPAPTRDHSIEAFVSRRANPFTDALALSAMKTIWRELPPAREPGNAQAREGIVRLPPPKRVLRSRTQAWRSFTE